MKFLENKDRFLGSFSIFYYIIISLFLSVLHSYIIISNYSNTLVTGSYLVTHDNIFDIGYWFNILGFFNTIFLFYWFIPILILLFFIKKSLNNNKEVLFFVIILIPLLITSYIAYDIWGATISCTGPKCFR